MKFSSKIPALILVSSFLFLSGCGGGGGGGGNDDLPSSTITAENADEVAAGVLSASDILNGQASTGGNLVTGIAVQAAPKTDAIDATVRHLYRVLKAKPSNTVTGVSGSDFEACPGGGSYTASYNVADPYADTPSSGDVVTLTYSKCVDEYGDKLNGSVRTAFSNISGTPDPALPWSATIKVTFTNFAVTYNDGYRDKLHGDMTLGYGQTGTGESSFSASGNSFQLSSSYDGTTYLFGLSSYDFNGSVTATNLYTYSSNFTVSGSVPGLGNNFAYTTKTLTEFKQQDLSNPHQGVMTVTATDGTSLKMTVLNTTQVQLELDTNADGTIDQTNILLWDDLLALM